MIVPARGDVHAHAELVRRPDVLAVEERRHAIVFGREVKRDALVAQLCVDSQLDVIDKEIPGIGEAMRLESLKKVRTAMLSRGTAGIKNSTLIVNLPGSAKGAQENLGVLLPILEHTVEKISKTAPVTKG